MQLLIMSGQRLAGVIYRYPKTRETTPPQRRTCHLRIPSLLMRARGVERHIRAKPLPGLTPGKDGMFWKPLGRDVPKLPSGLIGARTCSRRASGSIRLWDPARCQSYKGFSG